jgi:hypothetical protein
MLECLDIYWTKSGHIFFQSIHKISVCSCWFATIYIYQFYLNTCINNTCLTWDMQNNFKSVMYHTRGEGSSHNMAHTYYTKIVL